MKQQRTKTFSMKAIRLIRRKDMSFGVEDVQYDDVKDFKRSTRLS